jgi:hypothetical protein
MKLLAILFLLNIPIKGQLVCVKIKNDVAIEVKAIKKLEDCHNELAKVLRVKKKRKTGKIYLECKVLSSKDTFIIEYKQQ